MIQLRPWKIALVVAALIFGVLFALPNMVPAGSLPGFLPGAKLNLGLDLQGGSYLLYEIDTAALKKEQMNNLVEEARGALQQDHILFTGLAQQPDTTVTVRISDPTKLDQAMQTLGKLVTQIPNTANRDIALTRGTDQTIQIAQTPQEAKYAAGRAVEQTIEIIRRRIDALGTREPSITQQGADRIVIEAAGLNDPEKLKAVIGKTAKLSFQMVDDSVPPADVQAGHVPPEDVVVPSDDHYAPIYVLQRRAVVTGEMLTMAQASFDQNGQSDINFRFNGQGARRFGDTTSQNLGKRFAIVLDNRVISAPVIQSAILGGSGQITGNFTEESAGQLALLLRSGALPAPLNVIEQKTVGAELGADAVRSGAIALGIGAVAIVVFILLAYGLFGVFATAALLLNVLMIVAIMSLTQATLTLPGIAGLILTLAVAVDANVLIYERMRDEARAGRSLILSIDSGYRLAWPSILDANVTTLISAAIMFQFGSGPVKGFAWTLAIGVITSVFTAILVTQVLIGWWFKLAKPKQLPI